MKRTPRCLLVTTVALTFAVSAGAMTAACAAPQSTTISDTPTMIPFAQTNGDVTSLAEFTVGGIPEVAFGGDFTTVTTPDGVVHPATNLAVVTETTGAFVFAETTLADDGYVHALAYNAGTLYVGGDFTTFDGVSRNRLAAVSVPGFAVTGWNPGASGQVNALAISQSPAAIYSAGASGTVRSLSLTTSAVNWSDPMPWGGVETLLSDPADGGLYVGGFFDTIDGFTNHGLIELNETSGAPVTTFTPVLEPNTPPDGVNGDDPRSLALDSNVSPPAIVSGGGGSANRMHLFNATTGAQIWVDSMIGDTQGVIQLGNSIIAGTHRTRINKPGGQWPYFAGQVSEATGAIQAWDPGLSGRPAMNPPDGDDNGVRAFAFDAATNTLVVGGDFLEYGQTCNLQMTLACTGGVPMASLAEFQVALPATPPLAPTGLTATPNGPQEIDLSWTAATPGTSPVTGYQVTRNGTVIATTAGTVYDDTATAPSTTYQYTVTAIDANQLASPPSSPATATTLPAVPPSPPTGLSGSATGPTVVSLSWTPAVAGTLPVTGYTILRNGVAVGSTTGATSFTDTGLSPNTSYDYTVISTDTAGNASTPSADFDVTTPDANLLTNPGFETWTNGIPLHWTTYGPATTLTESSDAHSGSSSVKIATTSTSYAASGIYDGKPPTISSDTPGVTYVASCWAKASRPMTISIELHEAKPNYQAVNTAAITSLAITDSNWHLLQVSDTTIGTGDILPLSVFSTNTVAGGATFEVDDCVLGRTN